MVKIGICGHFGKKKNLLNGQTIKTKTLTEEIIKHFGPQLVKTVDTHGWRQNSISLVVNCYQLINKAENLIILPAHNGIKVFAPLFMLLNKVFNRKLHYVVIGGWLSELLEKNQRLKNQLNKFEGIYVETDVMVKSLQEIGLENVRHLPNFKHLDILEENSLVYPTGESYKFLHFREL